MEYPQFSICAHLDLTAFVRFRRERGLPFFSGSLYPSTRAANGAKEFRYQIWGEALVEHERGFPTITVMGANRTFGNTTVEYAWKAGRLLERAVEVIARTKERPTITKKPDQDEVTYYTSFPWVSSTASTHPISLPANSIPRIAWGKYSADENRVLLPYSVQIHHGLADGLHVGNHFNLFKSLLDQPEVEFSADPESRSDASSPTP